MSFLIESIKFLFSTIGLVSSNLKLIGDLYFILNSKFKHIAFICPI